MKRNIVVGLPVPFGFLVGALAIGLAPSALAQAPAAVVEDIAARNAGVDLMDYVSAGRVLKLAGGETLTLSYLKSCVRETIIGGTVTVGAEQSMVTGGKVDRQTVKCDGGRLALTADQSAKSGAMVFRRAPTRPAAHPDPEMTLYGMAPVLIVPGGGTVLIERLDAAADKLEIVVPAQQLRPRAYYDLAIDGKALVAGGLYRASTGSREIIFNIDANAAPGRAPLIGRLLQFAAK